MGDYFSDFSGDDAVGGAMGFWGGLHPGIRSAAIMWVLLMGIAVLHSFTAGASLALCYPVQVLLYVANGALASYFALGSGYHSSDLPRVGAIAGFVAWILPAAYYLVFGIFLGLVTLGIGFVGIAALVLCGPIDLAIHAACGAIGAWLYGRRYTGETEWY